MEMPDYLFLDCEWADACASELVSIGLVSLDGERSFYAECADLPVDPTPWVRVSVYPLLERGLAGVSPLSMSRHLNAFLASLRKPVICYDFSVDRILCERVLQETATCNEHIEKPQLDWQLLSDIGPALKSW